MDIEAFRERMAGGQKVAGGSEVHRAFHAFSEEARRLTVKINTRYHPQPRLRKLFSRLTGGTVGENFVLFPPFYTDCGKNIRIGDNVFINAACCFQDQGGITIGDGTLIGHTVVLATLNHNFDPCDRESMFPRPIVIGRNVWIGSHATILPGVTIGDNAIVAAGAVVTKDVAANTVVGGVPARMLRDMERENI